MWSTGLIIKISHSSLHLTSSLAYSLGNLRWLTCLAHPVGEDNAKNQIWAIYTLSKTFPLFLHPPIFTGQSTHLTKLPPLFFKSAPLTKTPPYFYFPLFSLGNIHPSQNSLEGKEAQNGGEKLSLKSGDLSPKLGEGSCTHYWFQIWGEDRSHCLQCNAGVGGYISSISTLIHISSLNDTHKATTLQVTQEKLGKLDKNSKYRLLLTIANAQNLHKNSNVKTQFMISSFKNNHSVWAHCNIKDRTRQRISISARYSNHKEMYCICTLCKNHNSLRLALKAYYWHTDK